MTDDAGILSIDEVLESIKRYAESNAPLANSRGTVPPSGLKPDATIASSSGDFGHLAQHEPAHSQPQVNCGQETRSAAAEPYLNVPLKASTGSTTPQFTCDWLYQTDEAVHLTPLIDLEELPASVNGHAHSGGLNAAFIHEKFPVLSKDYESLGKRLPGGEDVQDTFIPKDGDGLSSGVVDNKDGLPSLPSFMNLAAERIAAKREETALDNEENPESQEEFGASLIHFPVGGKLNDMEAQPNERTQTLHQELNTHPQMVDADTEEQQSARIDSPHSSPALDLGGAPRAARLSRDKSTDSSCDSANGAAFGVLQNFITSIGRLTQLAGENQTQEAEASSFDSFIRTEIKNGVNAWLNANLKKIVEDKVEKELKKLISRLMV
ncbi:MAG: DUF2497 domain-containing protein [Holosporales bacterium]|jgi:cell pole-organizing protein PopZ|nr:DUF2497 domain-containing protein [Holosporales bacterium]